MEKVHEKFLRYVAVGTSSSPEGVANPTTKSQFELAGMLVEELKAIGLGDAFCDDNCYVYAHMRGNVDSPRKVGFLAHLDTSPDFPGEGIKPRIIRNYDCSDIVLNEALGIVTSPSEFKFLEDLRGHDLIVADGTTLLGADDKAGIAEIMCALDYFAMNPDVKRPDISICFTPDEEVGMGTDSFDLGVFDAAFAYTLDGDELGSLEYENFNAAKARVTVNGSNIHPGHAKDRMKNAINMGMELHGMLPGWERPEHTEGREGFFHLNGFDGSVEKTFMDYIIRDHDKSRFIRRKKLMESACDFMNRKHGHGAVELHMADQYFNMREMAERSFHVVESAIRAMEAAGVSPVIKPIRGGTDGARLSFMGLVTPNLFTGGRNFHGKHELVSINHMEMAVKTVIELIRIHAQ
jgi:tripeptide aminopeptidase